MAYGLKYQFTFDDWWGDEVDLQILRRDYTGSSSNPVCASTPLVFSLESEPGDAITPGIRGTVAHINLRATSLTQYDEFFTFDNRMFQVKIYKNAVIFWEGFIDPELCSKPIQAIYEVNLKASTGIGYLRDIQFKRADGTLYRTRKSLHSCLYACLEKIDPAPKFYDGCDIWDSQGDTDYSPLTQEYLDPRLFRRAWNEADSCYDVINEILKIKHAKMFKYKDGWWIIPVDNYDATLTVRVLTGSAGTLSSTISGIDMRDTVTNASGSPLNVPINMSSRVDFAKPVKELTVTQDNGLVNNLFVPWYESDFSQHYNHSAPVSFSIQFNQENDELELRHNDSPTTYETDYCQYNCGWIQKGYRQTVSVKLYFKDIRVNTRVRVFMIREGARQFLDADGNWQNAPTALAYLRRELNSSIEITDNLLDYLPRNSKTVDVTSKPVEISGYLYLEFAVQEDGAGAGYSDIFDPTYTVVDVKGSEIRLGRNQFAYEEDSETKSGTSQGIYIPSEYRIKVGGINNATQNKYLMYYGGMYRYVDSAWGDIRNFISDKVNGDLPNVLATRMITIGQKPRKLLNATILGHFTPITHLDYLDRIFAFCTFEYDMKRNVWEIMNAHEIYNTAEEQILLEDGEDILLEDDSQILLENG